MVRALQQTKEGGLSFKAPKSRKGRRRIALPSIAVEKLQAHREKQVSVRELIAHEYHDTGLICSKDDGDVWAPSAFTSAYRDAYDAAKFRTSAFTI